MGSIPQPLRQAILAALYWHECRSDPAVAYRLSFARIGQSGASFGPLQADCHAYPPALAVIEQICRAASMPVPQLGRVLGLLHRPLPQGWPGSAGDLAAVDAAIASTQGRAAVDRLMQVILDGLVAQLDRCIDAAAGNGAAIEPAALIGMAIWINQDGPPTVLLQWLRGAAVELGDQKVEPPAPGAAVDLAAWLRYYEAIPFIRQHPAQTAPMRDAIAIGLATRGDEP